MPDLFADGDLQAPLAERMRPRSLDEVLGQEHLTGSGGVLRRAVESGEIPSMILWGPPGTGKTTLARILGTVSGYRPEQFSAVLAGVRDVRRVAEEARQARRSHGLRTLLFIDEVHRFNKAQQDALLPHVEDGTIVLIGATTENPSFEVISALLSRSHVFVVKPLGAPQLRLLAERALSDAGRGLGGRGLEIGEEALESLIDASDGDARQLLNALETLGTLVAPDAHGRRAVTGATLRRLKDRIFLRSDRQGEEHFNLISALHKSVRGSDPDATLYWLARMLESGQDPLYVARRLVRMASEDVGLADPAALMIAVAARDAVHFIGLPEGALALAEAAVYMALAPKSNSLELAYGRAREAATEQGSRGVPLHLRNAPTRLMKELGYGRAYRYPHDVPGRWVEEDYFPEGLRRRRYYEPSDQGREARLWAAHLERIRRARQMQSPGDGPRRSGSEASSEGEDRKGG
ncbi:MAG: AAA family ATPase [Candidatus Eisenbacteria bacterium]|nr:AAA family ATPase [Candidatus Eisenbacteria bacterium]